MNKFWIAILILVDVLLVIITGSIVLNLFRFISWISLIILIEEIQEQNQNTEQVLKYCEITLGLTNVTSLLYCICANHDIVVVLYIFIIYFEYVQLIHL